MAAGDPAADPEPTVESLSSRDSPGHRCLCNETEGWSSPQNIISLIQLTLVFLGAIGALYVFYVADRPEKTKFDDYMKITDLGPVGERKHQYLIEYDYSVTNSGPFLSDVSYAIVSVFKANLPLGHKSAIVLNGHREKGHANWELLYTKGHRSEKYWKPEFTSEYTNEGVNYIKGGGGTGKLHAGETAEGSVSVIIQAEPSKSLLACEVRFGINGGKSDANRWRYRKVELISQIGARIADR